MALTKVDDRGLNTPIQLLDNEYLRLGTGNDFEMFHNGNHSFLQDVGTGNLYINSTNGNIHLRTSSNEQAVTCVQNAEVVLYHNNSRKFETTSAGAEVTGTLRTGNGSTISFSDNVNLEDSTATQNNRIKLGANDDLSIYHDGSHSYLAHDGTGALRVRGDLVQITDISGGGGGDSMATFASGGAAQLYYNNTKRLETKSDGARFTGHLYANDNEKIRLGTGHDLEIYHDGSYNIIKSNNSHNIEIKIGSNTVIKAGGGGEAQLLYSGSKKLETLTGGVDVTGELQCDSLDVDGTAEFTPGSGNFVNFFGASNHAKWDFNNSRFLWDDNAKAVFGTGIDLQIHHSNGNSFIDNDTGNLLINTASGEVQINKSTSEYMARFISDSGVELYNDNEKKWATGSNGVYHDHNGTLHENAIHFQVAQNSNDYATLFGVTNYPDHSSYTSQASGHWARIQAKGGCVVVINSDASNRNDGRNGFDHFSVYQRAGESTNGKRLFSVDGEGAAQFGRAGIRIDNAWGAQPSITVQRNNNNNTDNTNDGAYMRVHGIGETHETWTGAGSAGADFSVNFIIDGSTYATSDGRAKTDIVDCPYGLDVVNKLQPRKYQLVNSELTPQGDDNINLGFIAQEIKEHIPECVNYLGDEANTPNEKGWARAYALDIGEVIPVLVKAIQELSAQVTALKAA